MELLLNADYVHAAFAEGVVETPRGPVQCFVRHAGDLILSTGRIVACDPLTIPEAEPFTIAVPSGIYPVTLAVARVSDVDQRIAFAKLQFAADEPLTWRMALLPDEDLSTLRSKEFFGYPVDAGTGCFMDAATSALLVQRINRDSDYYETIVEEMDKTNVPTWSYANVRPSPESDANLIAFSSGWGDGSYASYFGYAAAAEPVCLVTDFDVLWREALPEKAGVETRRKRWWKFW
jgi:Protein of unknown function (DUF4241)